MFVEMVFERQIRVVSIEYHVHAFQTKGSRWNFIVLRHIPMLSGQIMGLEFVMVIWVS